jgi:hypothetical protein
MLFHDEQPMEIIPLMCSHGSTKIGTHLTFMGYINSAKSYVDVGVYKMKKKILVPRLGPHKLTRLSPITTMSILQNPMSM